MQVRGLQIAGGLALVGVALLVVLSFTYRPSTPETVVSTGDSVLGATPTASPSPTSTAEPTASPTPTPTPSLTEEPTASDEVAIIPEDQRADIAIQVVNGGAVDGAAGEMTQRLRDASFDPRDSENASAGVQETVILYAEGHESEAATANTVIGVDPLNLLQATDEDANWSAAGADLDVLVVLGPGLP